MARRRNVAVVLAGGVGTRFGEPVPKQLLPLAGRPVMEHSIATFQGSAVVDDIVVVMAPGHLEVVRALIAAGGYDKVRAVVPGGATRSDSTVAALAALGEADVNVLLHDAARPLVTEEIVSANVAALAEHEAATTAISSADTIVQVDPVDGQLVETLSRPLLRRMQTPQSFRLATLRAAYALAVLDPTFAVTDDATVVLRYLPDVPIAVVPGSERNLKITTPLDLVLAEQLLRAGAG